MSKFIIELQVSLNKTDEAQYRAKGLSRVYKNLYEGAEGNGMYLWIKKDVGPGITRIQFSFDTSSSDGLTKANYSKVDKNLNQGAGNPVYLWYSKDVKPSKLPITELDVSTDPTQAANHMADGWEPLTCNLNRFTGGKRIYLWVKREKPTYIKEIKATNNNAGDSQLFNSGYIRMDENINGGTDGKPIFLWYLPDPATTEVIRDLQVSVTEAQFKYYKQSYSQVDQDLNEGTGGNQVYLWYKTKDGTKNIQSLTLISDPAAMSPFRSVGATVIEKSLHSGNGSPQTLLLVFN